MSEIVDYVDYNSRYRRGTLDPLEERAFRRREEEREQRERQQQQQPVQQQFDWQGWFTSSFYAELRQQPTSPLLQAVAQFVIDRIKKQHGEHVIPEIARWEARVKELESELALNTRFAELERGLDARQAGRDASKKGAKGERGERGAQGEMGPRGARGPAGPPGLAAANIIGWKVDAKTFRAIPFYQDGRPGPAIELRSLFVEFIAQVDLAGRTFGG